MIPYGRQSISREDIDAVVAVLQSDFLTQGPQAPCFEEAVADYCGAGQAIAVNSATSALHIACLALGLGPGDRLWTSPNSFVASANCALYCGATVDFVDIDPHSYNMSTEALEEKLAAAKRTGLLPKIVIPVHFAGQSCDMRGIRRLADEYGFHIIEDASHAIGGRYLGKPVGNCAYSDITVFSFHPVKIITTGEGGMALTNRPDLAAGMRRLRSHGITRDNAEMEGPSEGGWYYQQIELGYNYRMTDMQAALGTSQMKRVDDFVRRRSGLALRYGDLLDGLPLVLPWQHPETASAWHLYPVRLDESRTDKPRAALYDELRNAGIGVNVHYIPIHLQPHYRRLGFKPGDFPEAERYYRDALSLPLFPGLEDGEQERVVATLRESLS